MADNQEDVILNVILKLQDGKLPPIDTKAADASIDAFKARVKAAQAEVAQAQVGMAATIGNPAVPGGPMLPRPTGGPLAGPGAPFGMTFTPGAGVTYGPPGQGFPVSSMPAGARFADFNQFPGGVMQPYGRPLGPFGVGANPIYPTGSATMLSGPWNGTDPYQSDYWAPGGPVRRMGPYSNRLSYGGPAHGPISDPGSWAASSLETSRGYNMAHIRDSLYERRASMEEIGDNARGGYRRTLSGVNQTGSGIMQLAAGIALLNKAAEEGAQSWDNFHTKFVATMSLISGGATTALGVSGMAVGGGRLALAGTQLLHRGLAGAGAFGAANLVNIGTMGVGNLLAGSAGVGAGLLTAGAAVAGGVGIGALAYGGYQLYQANQENNAALATGRRLDARLDRLQAIRASGFDEGNRQLGYDIVSSGLRGDAGVMGVRAGNMTSDQFAGIGAREIAGIRASTDRARRGMLSLSSMGDTEGVGRYYDGARDAAREIYQWQQRINDARREELQTQQRSLQITREQLTEEKRKAEGVRNDVGRIRPGDFARLQRLGTEADRRGGLNPRLATYIEGIVGYREGGDASEFLNQQGQQRIDENGRLRRYFGDDARTSDGMKRLEGQIEANAARISDTIELIKDTFARQGDALDVLAAELDAINRREEARTTRTMQRAAP